MSKELEALLKDFETIAGYKPYRCDDNEQLWNLRVIECLPEVNWEALKQALTTDRTLEIVKELKDVVYCLEYLTKRWTGNSFNKSYRLSLDFSVVFDRIDFDKLNKIISESEGTK